MKLILTLINRLRNNPLYRNSFWLMAGAFVMAGVGFFYWLIAARLYTPEEIGLGATFLSVAAVINLVAVLGFATTLIRYLPTSDTKEKKINTSFTIVSLAALLSGIIYLVGVTFWTDKMLFLRSSMPAIIMVLAFFPINMLNTIMDSVFTAYRDTKWVFVSNVVQSIGKLILLILFAALGVWGIIASNVFGVAAAVIICLYILYSRFGIKFRPMIDNVTVQKVKKYAAGNYILGLVGSLPALLLPIIITNRISSEQTAYFYMPNMISSVLIIVPTMISRSYLSEGSHANKVLSIKKPLLFSYAILLPITLLIIIFGREILNLFGENYARNGYQYLVLISISVLISVVNYFLGTKLLIEHKLGKMTLINIITAVVYVGTAWWLTSMGIVGVGIAAVLTQVISFLALIILK